MMLLALVLLGVACGQTIPAVYYVGVAALLPCPI